LESHRVRYLTGALAGLAVGVLLATAVLGVEMVQAQRQSQSAITCADFQCFGAVQFGSVWGLLLAFVVEFAAAFVWFLRRPRRVAP
jgi:hypothetical protein